MPRVARIKSSTGIYHIMVRGINLQEIFTTDDDYKRFLHTLAKYNRNNAFEMYAYCLMGNHVHLLLKEVQEPVATIMKRIGTSYAYHYNWQYNRKGHLFQDRYKSEPVEDDSYFLTVLRYIHMNPLKAGLSSDIISYPWSSYSEYINSEKLVNTCFALGIFNQDKEKAIQEFIEFHNQPNNEKCLDIVEKKETISDKKIMQLVTKKYSIELSELPNSKRDVKKEVLIYLKNLEGCSIGQLSRLTGLSKNQIIRA